ncbi:MAG: nicotinamide mononucleotide transporter, partial [Candidatus Obscuribacterales bacterium]|nr:nicotinamide mononucleotide transporter [Steroidobacteraceae bacterium]
GWWLHTYRPDAAMPYVDAFVTWGSVLTTFMVARHVLENWLYWIVIDGIAAYLYFSQGLALTSMLFLIYVGIVIHGYRVWSRESPANSIHS